MSRLILLRFSFLSIKNLVNKKINIVINLSIFVIIFALSASFISILFENRIEQLETKVTTNEVNQILYTKWLNRSPKIIIQINNSDQNRKNQNLFADIIKEIPGMIELYSKREEYYNYYFHISKIAQINFRNMNSALTDALLLSSSIEDVKLIENQKKIFAKLIFQYDDNRDKANTYEEDNYPDENYTDKELDAFFGGFNKFISKNSQIIEQQRVFFTDFVSIYFSKKRKFFSDENFKNLNEINDLANLETRFIFSAFLIQFIIFIILQIFEITIERERRNEKS